MTHKLLETVVSISSKENKVYGNKGDKVKLIDSRGNVSIVEDKFGRRFSVKTHKLQEL